MRSRERLFAGWLRLGFLFAIAVLPLFAQVPLNEGANDFAASAETAGRIAAGQALTGAIAPVGDKDWVSVDVAASEVLWVMLTPSAELRSPMFTLYDSKGIKKYSTDSRDREFVHVLIARAPERFYLEIAGSEYTPSTGSYRLTAGRLAVGAQPGGVSPVASEPVEAGEWQTSFPAFAARVRERASSFGPTFPGGSLGLLKGFEIGGCSSDRPNLAGFGQIRFRATYRGLTPAGQSQRIAHGSDSRIDLEIERAQRGVGVAAFVYPAADSIEKWRALKPGAKIEFTANVNCIMNVDVGGPTQVVTLHDSNLVAPR